jgi:hypothetical protein
MILIFFLLLVSSALAAEPDPRLINIATMRQALNLQKQNGQLLYENAELRLKDLDQQEAAIKAEKPKEEKAKEK